MMNREIRTGRAAAIGLGLALSLTLLPAASARAEDFVRMRVQADAVKSYWTPERLREARPLPTPRVALENLADLETAADEALTGDAGSASGEGRRPLPGIRPMLSNRLFDPADASTADARAAPAVEKGRAIEEIDDRAAGSAGAYFTSHRLIPEEADLFYPYSTVGKLFFTIPGQGNFYCSGAVIRRRLVLTAGNCIHAGKTNPGFFQNFLFVPAFRDNNAPFSSWAASFVYITSTWATSNGKLPNAADYGTVEIQDQLYNGVVRKIGDVTGFLGYVAKKLKPNHATLLGYCDNFDSGQQMHQVDAKDFKATSASTNTVEYGSDMRAGSVGGPVLQDFGDNPALVKVIGVLSYFPSSAAVKTEGASIPDTRFTSLITTACNRQAGNC